MAVETVKEKVFCSSCGSECNPNGITTGYGQDKDGNKVCFECCGKQDLETMRNKGDIWLYLTFETAKQIVTHIGGKTQPPRVIANSAKLTNWPGSLLIKCNHARRGNHNMAGYRYDVWFDFVDGPIVDGKQTGHVWHGVQYGDNTQLCHCKRTKQIWRQGDAA